MRLWEIRRRMDVWILEGDETTGEVGLAVSNWPMMRV